MFFNDNDILIKIIMDQLRHIVKILWYYLE